MATNWEEELEWEMCDITPDMLVGDPILKEQQRMREERIKIEEADHELTEELFQEKVIEMKDKELRIFDKMKSSSIKLVDEVIKRTRSIKLERPKTTRNKKKIYDEHMFNRDELNSFDIEEKFFYSRR